MKISSIFCASIVSLAAALASNAAFAATTIKGSKSNGSEKAINANDPNAVSACTKGGGTVGKDPKGQAVCFTPVAAAKSKK